MMYRNFAMGWDLSQVATGGINEGMSLGDRFAKYGIDPDDRYAMNKLRSAEHKEAQEAGLAPDIPITPEAAAYMEQNLTALVAADKRQKMIFAGLVLGGIALLILGTRKK